MIKVFEPFQSKIKLHIRRDFLQELWDRYVPASWEAYDHISLIYLKNTPGQAEEGPDQVRLLVELVLKNLFVQVNLNRNPMLVTQNAISTSLQYTMKSCLTQLKSTGLQVYQSLNRYISFVLQAEEEYKRYEVWKQDDRMIRQMEREYKILEQLSRGLRELVVERAAGAERNLGNELFGSMSEPEYRVFAKSMVWQERKQIIEYIRSCSQAQYRQITGRLARNAGLYSEILSGRRTDGLENRSGSEKERLSEDRSGSEKGRLSEDRNGSEKERLSEDRNGSEKERLSKNGSILQMDQVSGNGPESEERRVSVDQHIPELKNVSGTAGTTGADDVPESPAADGVTSRERLIQWIEEYFSQEEFWEFYHKVLFPGNQMYSENSEVVSENRISVEGLELLPEELLVWRESGAQMTVYLNRLGDEKFRRVWKKIRESALNAYENQEPDLKTYEMQEAAIKTVNQQDTDFFQEQIPGEKEGLDTWTVFRKLSGRFAEMRRKRLIEVTEELQNLVLKTRTWKETEIQEQTTDFQTALQHKDIQDSGHSDQMIEKLMSVVKTAAAVTEGSPRLFEVQSLQDEILRICEETERILEVQKARIAEHEFKALNAYQDILDLRERIWDALPQEAEFSDRDELQREGNYSDWDEPRRETEYFAREALQRESGQFVQEALQRESEEFVQDTLQRESGQFAQDALQRESGYLAQDALRRETEYSVRDGQQESGDDERIFRHKYRELYLSERAVGKLRDWSRTLLAESGSGYRENIKTAGRDQISPELETRPKRNAEQIDRSNRSQQPEKSAEMTLQRSVFHESQGDMEHVSQEDRDELRRFVEQIQGHGGQPPLRIQYRESSFHNPSVRELVRAIRQMDGKQYLVFVRVLSDMLRIQQQVVRKWTEKHPNEHPEEQRILDVEKIFRAYYGNQITEEEVRELREWSEQLLMGSKPVQPEERPEAESISQEKAEGSDSLPEDLQTEIIRQQIQIAKDRSELHQLVEQVNHYAGEAVRLEYREESLQNPSIRRLIRHIRELNEEQHRLFVRQLSEMIGFRQRMPLWQRNSRDGSAYSEASGDGILQSSQTGGDGILQSSQTGRDGILQSSQTGGDEIFQSFGPGILRYGQSRSGSLVFYAEGNSPENQSLRFRHRLVQKIYEIYPELSHRIQEYEVHRVRRYEEEARRLQSGGVGAGLRLINASEETGTSTYQEPSLLPVSRMSEERQELEHALSRERMHNGRETRDSQIQEERMRMKSAQAQLEVRLKQVEQQLKQTERLSNGKEDVRETAEKIKKLLHEELHLEKLRRGLI